MADATDNVIKLKIDGEMFDVDVEDLELGEIGTVEDLCGESYLEIDWTSARGRQGLAWIVMHRKNPRFSMADAARIKMGKFSYEPDEADDEAKAAKKSAPRPTKTT